ncbi:hypothetical protein OS493_020548 [Desmophyllum pertusum]|uniref:Uncharacterized protein n=1 Tax=Desmophyllum pertusum TaxID=174260 RepID=A0A9W9YYU6_9CNID|nr:hypothetical protein OS493_020548 [Desmophyllum pertusum]
MSIAAEATAEIYDIFRGKKLRNWDGESFIHKSIQEFLGGVVHHLQMFPCKEISLGIEEYARVRAHPPCNIARPGAIMVFQFICGLWNDGSVKVLVTLDIS